MNAAMRQTSIYEKAYSLQQGRIDNEADRVEQHEFAISDKKMGTDNIQQCVVVVVHDPETKKTALLHFDRTADPNSITKDVLTKFPSNSKLNVHVVGGGDRNYGKEASDANIAKVMGALNKDSRVNIKSADIGDKSNPTAICFDPQTGKLEHAVPGKIDKTASSRFGKMMLANDNSPLYQAFDLTKTVKSQKLSLTSTKNAH